MTNHLAAELRQILDVFDGSKAVYQQLLRLTEYVEHAADQPVEADASTELAASFGLEPEQEIRADALDSAARLLAPALSGWSPLGVEDNRDTIARLWLDLAQQGEAWVSTGGTVWDDDPGSADR